jgi:hypothetical protein
MLQTQFKTQIPSQSSSPCSSFWFSESGVREGSGVRPTPKWQRPLLDLRWSWQRSVLRLLLAECGNFFLRIGVLLRAHKSPLSDTAQRCFSEHRLLLVCNDDMTQLQRLCPWLGLLDIRIACLAWALGVEAAHRTSRNEESSREPISS